MKWDSDFSTFEGHVVLKQQLSSIIQIAIQKPIKQGSIMKALSLKSAPSTGSSFGLTTETLHAKIKNMQATGLAECMGSTNLSVTGTQGPVGGSIGDPYIGIKLSAEDVKYRGRSLIK